MRGCDRIYDLAAIPVSWETKWSSFRAGRPPAISLELRPADASLLDPPDLRGRRARSRTNEGQGAWSVEDDTASIRVLK